MLMRCGSKTLPQCLHLRIFHGTEPCADADLSYSGSGRCAGGDALVLSMPPGVRAGRVSVAMEKVSVPLSVKTRRQRRGPRIRSAGRGALSRTWLRRAPGAPRPAPAAVASRIGPEPANLAIHRPGRSPVQRRPSGGHPLRAGEASSSVTGRRVERLRSHAARARRYCDSHGCPGAPRRRQLRAPCHVTEGRQATELGRLGRARWRTRPRLQHRPLLEIQ